MCENSETKIDSIPLADRMAIPPNHPLNTLMRECPLPLRSNLSLAACGRVWRCVTSRPLLTLHGGGSRNLLGLVDLLGLSCGVGGQALVDRAVILTRQLLKSTALGLGNQPSSKNTTEHETTEDLHDMVEPGRSARARLGTLVDQGTEDTLCDDGTDLAGGCADSMRGRAVASWETFAGHDEGSCIGAKVKEELRQYIQCQQATVVLLQRIVCTTYDEEDDRQDDKSGHLNCFAAEYVHGADSEPVARNSTGTDQNQVADGVAVESFVHVLATGPTNRAQDDGVVETQAVESYREEDNIRLALSNDGVLQLANQAYRRRGRTRSLQYPGEP